MKNTLLKIAPVALLALAACNNSETATDAEGAEAAAKEAKPAEDMQLPPSIVANDVYRCGDNSVLYVDFMGREGKEGPKVAANIRVGDKSADAIKVKLPVAAPAEETPAEGEEAKSEEAKTEAPAAEGVMTSEDGEATLSGEGAQIKVKLPGKGEQSCKA